MIMEITVDVYSLKGILSVNPTAFVVKIDLSESVLQPYLSIQAAATTFTTRSNIQDHNLLP